MITAVPADLPVTVPTELIVAFDVSLLLQAPPADVSESGMVEPTQTDVAPVIAPGNQLMLIPFDFEHPVGSV